MKLPNVHCVIRRRLLVNPGEHQRAVFNVTDSGDRIDLLKRIRR